MVFNTPLGRVHLTTNIKEVEFLFQTRCLWQEARDRDIQVEIVSSTREEVASMLATGDTSPSAQPRTVAMMEAIFLVARDSIKGYIPSESFCLGAMLDWIWLALPIFCSPEGYVPLHGSAVVQDGKATLLLGESGSGKSTAAQYFLDRGYSLLNDDICLLRADGQTVLGWDLWQHLAPLTPTPFVDFSGKVRQLPTNICLDAEVPVELCYILDEVVPNLKHIGDGFDTEWIPNYVPEAILLGKRHLPVPKVKSVCIATPFAGKEDLLDDWADALISAIATLPEVQFVWLCNSPDQGFYEDLKEYAKMFPNVLLWQDIDILPTKPFQVAMLWSKIALRIEGTPDYILTLEDDVLVDPATIDKLLRYAEFNPKAIIGVPLPYRYEDGHVAPMAWIHREKKIVDAYPSTQLEEVDSVSFSCTLFPGELFTKLSFLPGDEPGFGYDQQAGVTAQQLGYKTLAAWDIDATHIKDGKPIVIDPTRTVGLARATPKEVSEAVSAFGRDHNLGAIVNKKAQLIVREEANLAFEPTPWVEKKLLHDGWKIQYPGDRVQRAETVKPRILFLNRDPYRQPQPGFGGDLVHLNGYKDALRDLGYTAGFRPSTTYFEYIDWDVLHLFHTQMPWVQGVYWSGLATNKPLVVSAITHGHPPMEEIFYVVKVADKVLCFSQSEVDFYRDRLQHEDPNKFVIVPMGLQDEVFNYHPDVSYEPKVFMAGRYCIYKNQLAVLKACRKLDIPITFAGPADHPEYTEYKAMLEEVNKGWSGATFLPLLSGDNLWREYWKAHVHVNASGYEPFGLVTLEALACKANIVHTKMSWAAEEFSTAGSLCDPDDVQSISDAIETQLNLPRGHHNYHVMNWKEATVPVVAIYNEVLAAYGKSNSSGIN